MASRYLLDSNILIHHQRGHFDINAYLKRFNIGIEQCYVSEITVIELKVGEIILKRKGYKFDISTDDLLANFKVLPISEAIDLFVEEKCRMQFAGTPAENNFDLLIGCTAVVHSMVMVTENIKDFQNIEDIQLENWIQR